MGIEPGHDDTEDARRPVEPSPEGRSPLSVVVVVAVIVAAATTIALLSGENDPPGSEGAQSGENFSTSETVMGVACPELREAAALFEADDQEGFAAAIERAGREAEDALQLDGVAFGKPERAALELAFLVRRAETTADARLERLLSSGVAACPPSDED